MAKFKTTPLDLDNTMPKELYSLMENKWHYCLNLEKEIRESTLANLFLEFKRVQITRRFKSIVINSSQSTEHLVYFKITLRKLYKRPHRCGKLLMA